MRASCAPVDRSIRIPKQAQVTKGLTFFRRWKNFLFCRDVRYMDEASSRLFAAHLASSRGKGRQIANKKHRRQTNGHPRFFRHDPCWSTWNVASAAPNERCGAPLRPSGRHRWQLDRNASMAAYPQHPPLGVAGLVL
jgi:hypothetical protein